MDGPDTRADKRWGEAAPGFPAGPEVQVEIRDLLLRLWGYKWLLAAVILLVVGASWVVLQQMTPRYTATATLVIEPPDTNVIDLDAVVEGLDTGSETIRAELIVLQSRGLAAKTLDRMDLGAIRQVGTGSKNGALGHLNPLNYLPEARSAGLRAFWRDLKTSIFGQAPPIALSAEEREALHRRSRIDRFLAGLKVEKLPLTRVVKVSFSFADPRFATAAANALVDGYVRSTLEVKYAGTRAASLWLSEQLEQLRGKVEASEAAVERVRQGEALVQGRSARLVSENISAINAQLAEARAETAQLRARVNQIEKLKKAPDWEDQSSAVLDSDLIQILQLEQFKLEREAAELSTEYGEKHPKMINVRAEVAEIRQKIRHEIDKIVKGVGSDLAVAQARESSLKRNLDQLTNEVGDLSEAEMRVRVLEREAKADRRLYDTFLVRYSETTVQEEAQEPDARVISYAELPMVPSYPPNRKILLGSLAAAVVFGLALVYAIETLDKGFRTAGQLESQAGATVFGLVPTVPLGKGKIRLPEDHIVEEPHSRYSEAMNLIYTNMKWSWDDRSVKTILISSALPKEGKTSTAISLARRAALAGETCLFIDCDLRHPQATKQLAMNLSPGLSDILAGDATLEEALQEDRASGAKLLSCGRRVRDPVALLRSDAFARLLERAKETFSFIVLDSSPVLAVAEPQILARAVDRTLLLVRWGKTPRQAALAAIKQLHDFGAPVSGVALTQVDLTRQSYYGYGEYGYYTSQMKGYYTG